MRHFFHFPAIRGRFFIGVTIIFFEFFVCQAYKNNPGGEKYAISRAKSKDSL